jgi:hypothetical protein
MWDHTLTGNPSVVIDGVRMGLRLKPGFGWVGWVEFRGRRWESTETFDEAHWAKRDTAAMARLIAGKDGE